MVIGVLCRLPLVGHRWGVLTDQKTVDKVRPSHGSLDLRPDNRQESLGQCPTIAVLAVRQQTAAKRIWPGDADLDPLPFGGESRQASVLFNRPKPPRRTKVTRDLVFASLVVRWWSEPAWWLGLDCDPLEVSIKREIEVEPRLFSVGDDVQSGIDLVVDRDSRRILDEFRQIILAKAVEVL